MLDLYNLLISVLLPLVFVPTRWQWQQAAWQSWNLKKKWVTFHCNTVNWWFNQHSHTLTTIMVKHCHADAMRCSILSVFISQISYFISKMLLEWYIKTIAVSEQLICTLNDSVSHSSKACAPVWGNQGEWLGLWHGRKFLSARNIPPSPTFLFTAAENWMAEWKADFGHKSP